MASNSVAIDAQIVSITAIVEQVVKRLSPSLPATPVDDPELNAVIQNWPKLPPGIKVAIVATVDAVAKPKQ
jgi:hypothetical protein